MANDEERARCRLEILPCPPLNGLPLPVPVSVVPALADQSLQATTSDTLEYFGPHEVGLWTRYGYWYANTGAQGAFIQLEVSPDAQNWSIFGSQTLAGGAIDWAMISLFSRYARLGFRSQTPGQSTGLTVWWQAQRT